MVWSNVVFALKAIKIIETFCLHNLCHTGNDSHISFSFKQLRYQNKSGKYVRIQSSLLILRFVVLSQNESIVRL